MVTCFQKILLLVTLKTPIVVLRGELFLILLRSEKDTFLSTDKIIHLFCSNVTSFRFLFTNMFSVRFYAQCMPYHTLTLNIFELVYTFLFGIFFQQNIFFRLTLAKPFTLFFYLEKLPVLSPELLIVYPIYK